MRNIKPLPEAVHSSVRSGIILFDLTRVVEELIYNSLDAGATKVSVFVSVGTCYIKVVDDGTGVTRDGLVLLGERYATSKLHHLSETDAATGSFGFRGEALGSISDVSLLEIVTKTHGRPNGYRKVMKGCKCLYLGIDDDRRDVGTTVVVRDLFYNQPVRRKYLQSSPKKVLHSVKKSVFRIALVHSNVSFKVVDSESDDELLCTKSSSSPLSLLFSNLGIEDSGSLHELTVTDGLLKLSGYVSRPCDNFSIKAFQYVYINSRFICKGPIHKLMNQLATGFKSFDPLKVSRGSRDKKRSRSQGYPTYILNLSCPQSHYDLTFEPSRTAVEFKDWVPVVAFLEKAITRFWSEHIAHGESSMHAKEISGKELWTEHGNAVSAEEGLSEVAKRHCRQNCLGSLGFPSSSMGLLTEENDHFPCRKENKTPYLMLHDDTSEFEEQRHKIEFVHQIGCSFQSPDDSPSKCRSGMHPHTDPLWIPDDNFFVTKNNFMKNELTILESSFDHVEDKILGSPWGNASNVDHDRRHGFSALSYNSYEFRNGVEVSKDFKKPTLQSCFLRRNLLSDWDSGKFEFQIDGLRTRQRQVDPNQIFDFFTDSAWQEETPSDWPSPRFIEKPKTCAGSDSLSIDSLRSLSPYRKRFAVENNFPPDSVEQTGELGTGHISLNSQCCSVVSESLFQTTPWDVEHFTHENSLEGGLGSGRNASFEHFIDSESGDWKFSHDIMPSSSSQENCSFASCINTRINIKDYNAPSRDIYRLLKRNNPHDIFTPRHSDIPSNETDWLYSKSCGKDNGNTCAVASCSVPLSTYIHKDENKKERLRYQSCGQIHASKERSRSHSAPPIYRGKRKFLALADHWTTESRKVDVIDVHDTPTFPETDELKHPLQSSSASNQYFNPSLSEEPLFYGRSDMKKMPENEPAMNKIQNTDIFEKSQCLHIDDDSYSFKDFTTKGVTDLMNSETKWRNNCPKIAESGAKLQKFNDQYNILDISSGILHLASNSLVPQSITKNFLQDAKVLHQVDKKFIPVVADGTLAIIDQHAADERIRLEDLRQKVLSGKLKTIAYLDAEKELVLPEIGYQLLHNYAAQIENWGWICNIHAQKSRSFTKNLNLLHKQPTVVTLLAVPCILGVNLSDVDLLEFLQQLADTDGSSTMPPSVLRILNLKACRGAIMFGDTLLPSECSLIVEELKRTSLCFQCAHGRPTTVPVVNLEALHKRIAKLVGSGSGGSIELWHGLRRHELSLQRAAQRLNSSSMG